MSEIMLNKSFAGSWGVASDENIPHEIINLFSSDNGKIYLYVPPYGGYAKDKNVKYLLITGEWHNKKTEILYLATGLKRMHKGGKYATSKDREALQEKIMDQDIRYNGKLLCEIKMSAEEEDRVFYCTFEAEKLVQPKKRMFLEWNGGFDEITENSFTFGLCNEAYKYQRQIGYIEKDSRDYEKILNIISNSMYWKNENAVKKVSNNGGALSPLNFLRLAHKEYDETAYTNLFFEFFSKNTALFGQFAQTILNIPKEDSYTIYKEVDTKDKDKTKDDIGASKNYKRGRIDLLAIGNKSIIVIENKIKSGLNGIDKSKELSQLTTYIEFIERKYPDKEKYYFLFEPNYNEIDISEFDNRRGKEFSKIRYSQIYNFFSGHKGEFEQGVYGKYAEDFVSSLYIHTLTMQDMVEQRFLKAIQQK
jgi:hypothetical protein